MRSLNKSDGHTNEYQQIKNNDATNFQHFKKFPNKNSVSKLFKYKIDA